MRASTELKQNVKNVISLYLNFKACVKIFIKTSNIKANIRKNRLISFCPIWNNSSLWNCIVETIMFVKINKWNRFSWFLIKYMLLNVCVFIRIPELYILQKMSLHKNMQNIGAKHADVIFKNLLMPWTLIFFNVSKIN